MPTLYAEGTAELASLGTYAADLQGSGFNRIYVGLLHIGRADIGQTPGDILINSGTNDLIIHSGQFNTALAKWPGQLAALQKSAGNNSTITSLYFSIGGAEQWVYDFRTLKSIIDTERKNGITNSPNNPKSVIYQNFAMLWQTFPMVEGIDLDNEELYEGNEYVIVGFTQMLNAIGFKVSFCPYQSPDFWIDCLQQVYAGNKNGVTGFNLQCYAGGGINLGNEQAWWADPMNKAMPAGFDAYSFITPGLWCRAYDTQHKVWEYGTLCPDQVQSQCVTWKGMGFKDTFIWVYDDLQTALKYTGSGCSGSMATAAYAKAIVKGYS